MSESAAQGENRQGVMVAPIGETENQDSLRLGERPKLVPPHGRGMLRPFRKGESGNPRGTRTAGAYVKEYANAWADRKSRAELQTIIDDENATMAQVAAARRLLAQGLETETESREATRLILDYTDGKPRQQVDVTQVSASINVTADMTPRAAELLQSLAGELVDDDDPPAIEGE